MATWRFTGPSTREERNRRMARGSHTTFAESLPIGGSHGSRAGESTTWRLARTEFTSALLRAQWGAPGIPSTTPPLTCKIGGPFEWIFLLFSITIFTRL